MFLVVGRATAAPALPAGRWCLHLHRGAPRDRLNLPRVAELGAPGGAIGGAGTVDGVFLTGILAGLLAAWIAPPSRAARRRSGPPRFPARRRRCRPPSSR